MNKVYIVKYPNGKIYGVYANDPSMKELDKIGRDYETGAYPCVAEYEVIDNR